MRLINRTSDAQTSEYSKPHYKLHTVCCLNSGYFIKFMIRVRLNLFKYLEYCFACLMKTTGIIYKLREIRI